MRSNEKGFSAVEGVVVAVVVVFTGFVGWYVWQNKHKTTATPVTASSSVTSTSNSDTYKVGLVTFEHASQISNPVRQEILTKVADPLVYYDNTDFKLDATSVVIDLGLAQDNKTRSAQYGYILTEMHVKTLLNGFVFGENGKIDYWFPGLCDDGGCSPYPTDFKTKYPANYQAYLDSQNTKK